MSFGPLSARELNIMRGKMLVTHEPEHDIWRVYGYIDWLEEKLNEADYEDMLGTEGWRRFFDHPDAE